MDSAFQKFIPNALLCNPTVKVSRATVRQPKATTRQPSSKTSSEADQAISPALLFFTRSVSSFWISLQPIFTSFFPRVVIDCGDSQEKCHGCCFDLQSGEGTDWTLWQVWESSVYFDNLTRKKRGFSAIFIEEEIRGADKEVQRAAATGICTTVTFYSDRHRQIWCGSLSRQYWGEFWCSKGCPHSLHAVSAV